MTFIPINTTPGVGLFSKTNKESQDSKERLPKPPLPVPFSLHDESLWAIHAAKERNLVDDEDSAVIFHSLNAQTMYLNHLKQAFDHDNALHAVSIKTNPHRAVLSKAVSLGFGLEAASMEEVHLAKSVGCPSHRIVFDSPIKRRNDIQTCHQHFSGMRYNANSIQELSRLPHDPNFILGLRVNPELQTVASSDTASRLYNVSHNESKFGVPISDKASILQAIVQYPIVQLHVHSGSSMSCQTLAVRAVRTVVDLALEANRVLAATTATSRRITTIDIGGGLQPERLRVHHPGEGGNSSSSSSSPTTTTTIVPSNMEAYARALRRSCPELWNEFELITEFGQWSTFYTGYAYSNIEYASQRGKSWVAYVHLGANLFMRDVYLGQPRGMDFVALHHNDNKNGRPILQTDLAGPLCFAGDYLGKGLELPQLVEGDGLLLLNTGSNAYGLWSRHCSRTIPKVLSVDYAGGELVVASPRTNPFLA